jgi:hypothetical protein
MSKYRPNACIYKINSIIHIIIYICILFLSGILMYILSKKMFGLKEGMNSKWSSDTITNFPPAFAKYVYAAQSTLTPPQKSTLAQLQQMGGFLGAPLQNIGVPNSDADAYIKNGNWNYSNDEIKAITELAQQTNQTATPKLTSSQITGSVNFTQIMLPFKYYQYTTSINAAQSLTTPKTKCVNGSMMDTSGKTKISTEQIPKLIPGFKFIKNACDPCILTDTSNNDMSLNFTCPFSISDASINPILEYSWGIGPYAPSLMSIPSTSSISVPSFSMGNNSGNSGSSGSGGGETLGDRIKGAVTSIMNIF